jgi:heme-degrading monooxygenase HmoA
MILEVAVLNVIPAAFAKVQKIISSMPGYASDQLQRCVENRNQYLLLVRWETLEDHTEGFRGSPPYQRWKALLHHFYDPFPTVEHYEPVYEN